MAIDGVGSSASKINSTNKIVNQVQNQSYAQARAAKSELFKQQTQLKADQNQAILSSMFNTGSLDITIPSIPSKKVTVPESAAKQTANTQTQAAPANPVAAGNTAVNTQATNITVANGKGNKVTGATGWASFGNAVNVNGGENTINIAGKNITGATETTFNATGGAAIRENQVTVTGNKNTVTFSGQNIGQNKIAITGQGNAVDLASGIKNVNTNINADNVTVTMKGNNPLTKSQSNWNVNVSANDINVTIENGKAVVSGAGATAEGVKIQIDEKARTITVTGIA